LKKTFLKSCPFCGADSSEVFLEDEIACAGHGDYYRVSFVVCDRCCSTGPRFSSYDYPSSDQRGSLAVAAWNGILR